MTQNSTSEATEAEIRSTETAEQAELHQAQTKHLQSRVVILRVNLNRAMKELNEAKERIRILEGQLPKDNEPEEGDSSN